MSDFLYSSSPRAEGELRRLLETFLAPVSETILESHGPWGSLAVAACTHDVSPLVADGGAVTVLLGWPVLHAATGFAAAPVLDEPRRAAVHRRLADDGAIPAAHTLDGPFAMLSIQVESRRATATTDRMGFIPLFFSVPTDEPRAVVIGSHVDAVAIAAGRQRDIDLVSATDFVVHSSITFPRTLYDEVEQLAPATARAWASGAGIGSGERYWEPLERSPVRYLGRAARALRTAFREAVRFGCEGRDHVGLLLSGGEDSRAVLGAIPQGVDIDAFIYGDWENREYRIASRVAGVYGAHMHFGQRSPDHYLAYRDVAPLLGTQHRYTDVHGYGLHRTLGLGKLPIVLGGYLSDSLLKAHYAHRPKRRSIRSAARLSGERRPPVIANAAGLREDLLRAVEARRVAHRDRLRAMRPYSADEWLMIWPFAMRSSGANIHGNRRLFRSYEPYVSNGVLEIAAGVPQWWKRERMLFHRAMRPFLARSWRVPHGRSKYPFFGPVANVPLGLGVKWARWVRDRAAGEAGMVQGPWPALTDLVRSAEMGRCRAALPHEGCPIGEIFQRGLCPSEARDAQGRWTPEQQLGLLQIMHLTNVIGAWPSARGDSAA